MCVGQFHNHKDFVATIESWVQLLLAKAQILGVVKPILQGVFLSVDPHRSDPSGLCVLFD